jgi:acyl-CoA reductase-like NAD-dependent aldehyde dehydrogenase
MRVMREESFGPIIGIGIAPVADDTEAIARMNDTNYGLTAGRLHSQPNPRRTHSLPRGRGQRVRQRV